MTCDDCKVVEDKKKADRSKATWRCKIGFHSWGYWNGVCKHEDGYRNCIHCKKEDDGGM